MRTLGKLTKKDLEARREQQNKSIQKQIDQAEAKALVESRNIEELVKTQNLEVYDYEECQEIKDLKTKLLLSVRNTAKLEIDLKFTQAKLALELDAAQAKLDLNASAQTKLAIEIDLKLAQGKLCLDLYAAQAKLSIEELYVKTFQ